jgi:hypothetical protein
MRIWQGTCFGLAAAALVSAVQAQAPMLPTPPSVPGAPGAGVPGVPGAPGTTPAAPATTGIPGTTAAPRNIWSWILPTPDQKAACQQCKQQFCQSQIGQLFNNTLQPVSLFSGGILSGCCPGPDTATAAELAQPYDSAEGAAGRIKQDEAAAKAKREAIRYLATVDCHRWPEAEAALIKSLRSEPNECVRWEAAMALGTGCCCTKPIIEALLLTVSGSDKDKNPAETSDRVRAAAMFALQNCLARCAEMPAEPGQQERQERPERPERPEKLTPPEGVSAYLSPYYQQIGNRPRGEVVVQARQALTVASSHPPRDGGLATEGPSVQRLLAQAVQPTARQQTSPPPAVAPLPAAPTPPPPTAAAQATAPPAGLLPPPGSRDLAHLFLNSVDPQQPSPAAVTAPPPAPPMPPPLPLPAPPAVAPAASVVPPAGSRDLAHLFLNAVDPRRPVEARPSPRTLEAGPPSGPVVQVSHNTVDPGPSLAGQEAASGPVRADNMPVFPLPVRP